VPRTWKKQSRWSLSLTFLRRMIDLLRCFRNENHPIRLNVDFKRDLSWWCEFIGQWNGISFSSFQDWKLLSVAWFDAARPRDNLRGFYGYMSDWFNGRWVLELAELSVDYKDLCCSLWWLYCSSMEPTMERQADVV